MMKIENKTIVSVNGEVGIFNNISDFVTKMVIEDKEHNIDALQKHSSDELNGQIMIAKLLSYVVIDDDKWVDSFLEAIDENIRETIILDICDIAAAYSANDIIELFIDKYNFDVMSIHWDILFANTLENSPYPTEEFMEFIYEKTGMKDLIVKKIISSSVENDIFFKKRIMTEPTYNLFPIEEIGYIIIEGDNIYTLESAEDMLKIACKTTNIPLILFFVELINSGYTKFLDILTVGIIKLNDENLFNVIFSNISEINKIIHNLLEVALMFDANNVVRIIYEDNEIDLNKINWKFLISEAKLNKTSNGIQELMNVSNKLDLIEEKFKTYSE